MGFKQKAWENRIHTSKRRVPNREIKKLYLFFLKNQPVALKFAAKLYQTQKDLQPSQQNPCTLVYELVLALNKCLKI